MPEPKRRLKLAFGLTIPVLAAIFTGLGVFKYAQIRTAIAQGESFQMPPVAVTSIVVEPQAWQPVLSSVGSLQAVNGVVVSTDLPGIVEEIAFESGQPVKEGDLLVKLDTKQEVAQLRSAEARNELAKLNLERQKGLLQKRVAAQTDYDAAAAEYKQSEAALQEIRALIERKTIRAPFSGVLGIRSVNLGQYLQGGDPVVPLQSMHPIYVNFSVPQQQIGSLEVGKEVHVRADGITNQQFVGKITSINSVVDEATRNILVQATLDNDKGLLRPGMFVNVEVLLPAEGEVLAIPASAVNYAPYGDSIFIIEDMKDDQGQPYKGVRQQIVKLGGQRGDQVAVLSGLESGQEVVTSGGFKLAPGAAVQINNSAQPSNEASPTPADS
jgi:RND family efflux transporter, MFP subunit